jgi:circadian clock protein KaiB
LVVEEEITMPKPTSVIPSETDPVHVRLRLYVSGNAPNSVRAIANAKVICASYFESRCDLEIVDLLTQPLRALADEIIVTPTLIKLLPLPVQRVVGNLSDTSQVLLALASA